MPETIDLLLKELKLPAFIRHQQQAIEKGDGHVRYLLGLCEQEAQIVIKSGCKNERKNRAYRSEKALPILSD